ncbi:hypothetical protein ODJ79_09010 [Actinoplanes sp. KI2]|uniref:hypothetical protein n=1 Tax=Actinoplanes sp. KI2 TaxID=2983315 RepID=UPI0021D61210|nr:hypothetical protein [Actinoplanes sp. KI2]MCU7723851.1 hypothetical protein [Actinoplanes sp. KI2]
MSSWARLHEEGDALTRAAGSAARATAAGWDDSESVRVALDTEGRVVAVTVAAAWRRRLGVEGLSDAVLAAVRDAAMRRLEAWGEVYGDDDRDRPADGAGSLNDVATGIIIFWTGLGTALVALVGGIIGALASSATIFGLPAAPFIAAGAALVASGAIITGCELLKARCASANTTLRQKLADNAAFHHGHWPPAAQA